MDQQSLIVDGFVFPSHKEAQIALKEKKNIEVIRSRTPLQDERACRDLYTKLIEREIFKTMVGYSFLAELRRHLVEDFMCDEESLPDVVLPRRMNYDRVNEINQGALKNKLEHEIGVNRRLKVLTFALIFIVIAMFIIATVNPNTQYLNVENKVLDKYSAWQEELERREQAVSEKEEAIENQNNEK